MSRPTSDERTIPQELLDRARHDPTLYHALTRYLHGDWTLEHAMTQAALNLSVGCERYRNQIVFVMERCTCGAVRALVAAPTAPETEPR
jgi:hypothetical protein